MLGIINPHYSPIIIMFINKRSKIISRKRFLALIITPKECSLKLSSRIYFVAKPLKYASIPTGFDASYLHKANFMNKAG